MPQLARDSQRGRLYRAKNGLFSDRDEPRFAAVPAIQDYYDRLLGTAWFRRRYAVETIKIGDGRGQRSACVRIPGLVASRLGYQVWGIMSVPRGYRRELILLHELARSCCDATSIGRREAAHG